MPINWQEVKKAVVEYKRKVTEAKKRGYKTVEFTEWAKRHYGKTI